MAKFDFPTHAVYGPTPSPVLRLITGGGPYTKDSGYSSNVTGYARWSAGIARTRPTATAAIRARI